MKLKRIKFIFENCDYVEIDGKYIGNFLVDKLNTSFQRIACNAIAKIDAVDEFLIEIHKDASKGRTAFGDKVFDRFKEWHDITSINFTLAEDACDKYGHVLKTYNETYDYVITWTGNNEAENDAQKSYISKDGNLYIVVSAEKDIFDYFDKDTIDDIKYMDFYFDMYDVGDEYSKRDREKKVKV